MKLADILRLVTLAAIWGGSFVFMRVLAPVLGPILTSSVRVALAGAALFLYLKIIGFDPNWKVNKRHYFVIGFLNSALPFALFSYAALHIPASYSVVLNSTSPIFGALFSALWLSERMSWTRWAGTVLGFLGVGLVVKPANPVSVSIDFWLSIGACLTAAMCYGLAGIYLKRFAKTAKPMGVAMGSQVCAALLLSVLVPFSPVRGEVTPLVVACAVGLALLCSAVAYLLYFRLMADLGPTRALSVTFLMPLFGLLWGKIFLAEVITLSMSFGVAVVLVGLFLSLRTPAVPIPQKNS